MLEIIAFVLLTLRLTTAAAVADLEHVAGYVGHSVTLPCHTDLDIPAEWRFWRTRSTRYEVLYHVGLLDDSLLMKMSIPHHDEANYRGDYSLTILNLTVNDTGLYQCVEDSGGGPVTYSAELNVVYYLSSEMIRFIVQVGIDPQTSVRCSNMGFVDILSITNTSSQCQCSQRRLGQLNDPSKYLCRLKYYTNDTDIKATCNIQPTAGDRQVWQLHINENKSSNQIFEVADNYLSATRPMYYLMLNISIIPLSVCTPLFYGYQNSTDISHDLQYYGYYQAGENVSENSRTVWIVIAAVTIGIVIIFVSGATVLWIYIARTRRRLVRELNQVYRRPPDLRQEVNGTEQEHFIVDYQDQCTYNYNELGSCVEEQIYSLPLSRRPRDVCAVEDCASVSDDFDSAAPTQTITKSPCTEQEAGSCTSGLEASPCDNMSLDQTRSSCSGSEASLQYQDLSYNNTAYRLCSQPNVDHWATVKPFTRATTSLVNNNDRFLLELTMDTMHKWRFLTFSTPDSSACQYQSSMQFVYSTDRHDVPTLDDGYRLLFNAVFHCLPHGARFSEPVFMVVALPVETDFSKLRLMFSDTDIDQQTDWKFAQKVENTIPTWFIDQETESDQRNRVKLRSKTRQLIFFLYHFCIFTVVLDDGREEETQMQTVSTLLKLVPDRATYGINILVINGCDDEDVAKHEQAAIKTGYVLIEDQRQKNIVCRSGKTITISVRNLSWNADAEIAEPTDYKVDTLRIWHRCSRSSLFEVTSESAATEGVENRFRCSVKVEQERHVDNSMDILISVPVHELFGPSRLPYCACSRCSRSGTSTISTAPKVKTLTNGDELSSVDTSLRISLHDAASEPDAQPHFCQKNDVHDKNTSNEHRQDVKLISKNNFESANSPLQHVNNAEFRREMMDFDLRESSG